MPSGGRVWRQRVVALAVVGRQAARQAGTGDHLAVGGRLALAVRRHHPHQRRVRPLVQPAYPGLPAVACKASWPPCCGHAVVEATVLVVVPHGTVGVPPASLAAVVAVVVELVAVELVGHPLEGYHQASVQLPPPRHLHLAWQLQ